MSGVFINKNTEPSYSSVIELQGEKHITHSTMQVKGYGDATTGNLKTNNTQTAALTATFCQSKIPWQMFVTITHLPHPHIWSNEQNVNSSCLDWLIEFTVACLLTCRGRLQWAATGEIQVGFEPPGLIDTAPLLHDELCLHRQRPAQAFVTPHHFAVWLPKACGAFLLGLDFDCRYFYELCK